MWIVKLKVVLTFVQTGHWEVSDLEWVTGRVSARCSSWWAQTPDSRRLEMESSYAKSLGGNKRFLDSAKYSATVFWIRYRNIMDEKEVKKWSLSHPIRKTTRIDVLPGSLCCMWWCERLLIYFTLGSKLMHFIWNIALSFLGIAIRPSALSLVNAICRRLSDCMHWSAAQVSAASARDHNCSIPCLGLGRLLAFQPSHWSINHAPNYMCTDLCCMPGFSLASQWLLWRPLIGQTAVLECSDWLGCWLWILLSASHFGSGSADWSREIARYLTK